MAKIKKLRIGVHRTGLYKRYMDDILAFSHNKEYNEIQIVTW